MKTTHTPGPWIADMQTGQVLSDSCDVGDIVVERVDGVGVALDGAGNIIPGERINAEADANIRLIAAAPELIASLEEMIALAVECGAHHRTEVERARKIVAKIDEEATHDPR